jgi:hypothetical protein
MLYNNNPIRLLGRACKKPRNKLPALIMFSLRCMLQRHLGRDWYPADPLNRPCGGRNRCTRGEAAADVASFRDTRHKSSHRSLLHSHFSLTTPLSHSHSHSPAVALPRPESVVLATAALSSPSPAPPPATAVGAAASPTTLRRVLHTLAYKWR